MEIEHIIKDSFKNALKKEVVIGKNWQEEVGLDFDPFFDFKLPLEWFIDRENEVAKLAEYMAYSENLIGEGFLAIIGGYGVGRHALIEVVCNTLEKEPHFRNRIDDDYNEDAFNVSYGKYISRSSKPPHNRIEVLLFTTTEYWEKQKLIKEKIIDEIWIKPLTSKHAIEAIEKRFKLAGFNKNFSLLFDEDSQVEICKYSQGNLQFMFYISTLAIQQAVRIPLKKVSAKIIRKIAEIHGFYNAYHKYPNLSNATKNVAKILVLKRKGVTTVEASTTYEEIFEEKDRSTFSRHLNKLVDLNLAERIEKGRAAFYTPKSSLQLAVDLEEYPEGI